MIANNYTDGSLHEVKTGQTTVAHYDYTNAGLLDTADYSSGTITNIWDADSNRVEMDANGNEHEFVYDTMAGVPAVIKEGGPSTTAYNIREPDGALIARTQGSEIRYYHFGALGSTRLLTDGDGDVTDRYAYDAYGAVLSHETSADSIPQPYQYVGELGYYTHWQEPGFGLLQLGVRFYDPEVGRFTQEDPSQDGLSWYNYVEDNPLVSVDPTGNFAIVIVGCALGAGEVAAAMSAVSVVVCGANAACRDALMQASSSIADAITEQLSKAKECCRRVIRLRCKPPWKWNHKDHRHPFSKRSGKVCYQYHLQINCWFEGIGKAFEWRIPYGPCFKGPRGPDTH